MLRSDNEIIDAASASISPAVFRVYNQHNFDQISQLHCLSEEQRFAIRVVAQVLPFRVNQYVVDQLIQWENVPDDPMFRLVFPQPEMLSPEHFSVLLPFCDQVLTNPKSRSQHKKSIVNLIRIRVAR